METDAAIYTYTSTEPRSYYCFPIQTTSVGNGGSLLHMTIAFKQNRWVLVCRAVAYSTTEEGNSLPLGFRGAVKG